MKYLLTLAVGTFGWWAGMSMAWLALRGIAWCAARVLPGDLDPEVHGPAAVAGLAVGVILARAYWRQATGARVAARPG